MTLGIRIACRPPGAARSPSARSVVPLLVLLLSTALADAPVRAQDLVVSGCDLRLPGEVGVGSLSGSVGQTMFVPVSVHAVTNISAFTLDVDLPAEGLAYVRTDPGTLFSGWDLFGGHYLSSVNRVRLAGADVDQAIVAGSVGTLAVLVFEVTAAGTGEIGTSRLLDNLVGYVSCEDAHGSSPVDATSWGRVKSAYR